MKVLFKNNPNFGSFIPKAERKVRSIQTFIRKYEVHYHLIPMPQGQPHQLKEWEVHITLRLPPHRWLDHHNGSGHHHLSSQGEKTAVMIKCFINTLVLLLFWAKCISDLFKITIGTWYLDLFKSRSRFCHLR